MKLRRDSISIYPKRPMRRLKIERTYLKRPSLSLRRRAAMVADVSETLDANR